MRPPDQRVDPIAERLAAARPEHDNERIAAVVASRLFGRPSEAKLGRFTLLEQIGRGGMGEVFAAYDPTLDRKVAIKLLRTDAPLERDALLREARAAARLAHPNVVAIHEVGESEAGIHIAMEYIAGHTLRAWRREPRSRAAILEVFVQAGSGLAAAHAAGVIHRDFKPENVLVGDAGSQLRARVVDFGLARLGERAGGEAGSGAATSTSTLAGTPGYMAPEQLLGQPIDARADQFAFGVALWEALTGEHPFGADRHGATLESILATVLAGERPRGDRALPAWLRRIVRRTLALDPERRYPSMQAVVDELRSTPARRGRRASLVVALALVAGSSALTFASVESPAPPSTCSQLATQLEGVWDPELRTRAHVALTRSGLADADAIWARLGPRVDDYANAWLAARAQTCEDRHALVALLDFAALLDLVAPFDVELRDACLDRRRAELRGLTELLVVADPTTIRSAIAGFEQLEPIASCDDRELLRREATRIHPTSERASIEQLRQAIALRTSQARAGHARSLGPTAATLVEQAEALGEPTPLAEALVLRSWVEEADADYDAAAGSLDAALLEAIAGHQGRLHAEIATRLVWIHGVRRRENSLAQRWVAHADAAIRAERGAPRLRARLLDHRGTLASLDRDFAGAERLHRAAIELRRTHAPEASAELAASEGNVGRALLELGRAGDAKPWIEQALARYRAVYGPNHPDVAAMLSNLGQANRALGDHEQALALLDEALALKQRVHGPDHPELITTLDAMATLHSELGHDREARALLERALGIGERELGPDAGALEWILHNLAFTSWLLGDHAATIRYATRALAIQRNVYGDTHPVSALTAELLARGLLDAGQIDAASTTIARALQLAEGEGLSASERGNLLISAALIERASGGSKTRVRELAEAARALLGDRGGAELDELLAAPG